MIVDHIPNVISACLVCALLGVCLVSTWCVLDACLMCACYIVACYGTWNCLLCHVKTSFWIGDIKFTGFGFNYPAGCW